MSSVLKSAKGKVVFCGMWLMFLAFLLIQHRAIYITCDDYGYASLAFYYDGNPHGMDWNLVDAFNFIKWHYMFHGGRVLFFSILVFALRLGQSFIQCFQAIWIWLSCFMMYTLFKRKRYDIFVALVTVTCFGSLSIRGLIDSVFWYTASVIFFWPILPMTIGFLLWKKGLTNKKTTFGCALAFFIADFRKNNGL